MNYFFLNAICLNLIITYLITKNVSQQNFEIQIMYKNAVIYVRFCYSFTLSLMQKFLSHQIGCFVILNVIIFEDPTVL